MKRLLFKFFQSIPVVAEELFSINMNIVIVMFPFRSADLLFTCGQRTCYSRAVSGFAHENVKKTWLGVIYSDLRSI